MNIPSARGVSPRMDKMETWRVVCEGGEVREVVVEDRGHASDGRRQYTAGGVYIVSESPRVAVVRWCAMEAHEKAVVELVAPGAFMADERVAAERARCATVCREAAARYRYGACGCEECEGRSDGARECAEAIDR